MSDGPIYTLAEQLYCADGTITYRGFVTSTNEAVYIHALPLESVELYDQALKLFRSYSVERPILNLFAFEGQPYVITRPGPEQTNFRSWLSAQTAMQDKRPSSPPILLQGGNEHWTPGGFDASGDRTVTADPSSGLPGESRRLSNPSTPNKPSPEQAEELTRIFGLLDYSKQKAETPGKVGANISGAVPASDPGLEAPSARRSLEHSPGKKELPSPPKPRTTTPADREAITPGMSDATRLIDDKALNQPNHESSEVPGNTKLPADDVTRLIRSNNLADRKGTSEPQLAEKREEPYANRPAYGPATRVFQSPGKNVGPASHEAKAGEFTRIYGSKDTDHQFAGDRADTNHEDNGREKKREQPAANVLPDADFRRADNKQRTRRLPLILVLIFSSLIVIAAVAYLAGWPK